MFETEMFNAKIPEKCLGSTGLSDGSACSEKIMIQFSDSHSHV